MMRATVLLAAWLLMPPFVSAAEDVKKPDGKKPDEKKPAPKKPAAKKPPAPKPEAFTDAGKAGPDLAVQGEYEGEIGGKRYAAQVVARGDGKFDWFVLAGGLPGAGWDGTTRLTRTDPPAVADGKLTVRLEDGSEGTLAKVRRRSPTEGAKPPEGAIVLFDGSHADEWENAKLLDTPEGKLLLAGTASKRKFSDFKIHAEFRLAFVPKGNPGTRSNSGLFCCQFYEVQIIDSFGRLPEKGGCGAMYLQRPATVNMTFPPLEWQTYDIEFTAPRYGPDGKKTANARITVIHNGVVIHDDREYEKGTNGRPDAKGPGPFLLQDHGAPVVYRNIWVVEKK